MSRRNEIADAAIRTLAREGMRGLTHRAVDRAAGLPEGSTSYYFRTRHALLQATVERLAELSAREIPQPPQAHQLPRAHQAGQGDQDDQGARDGQDLLDGMAALIAEILERWMTSERDQHLARYELALEATRRPELREILVAAGAGIRAMVAAHFATLGVQAPDRRAADFVAFLDGLLFDQIAGAGNRTMSRDDLRAAVRTLLAGTLAQRGGAHQPPSDAR